MRKTDSCVGYRLYLFHRCCLTIRLVIQKFGEFRYSNQVLPCDKGKPSVGVAKFYVQFIVL